MSSRSDLTLDSWEEIQNGSPASEDEKRDIASFETHVVPRLQNWSKEFAPRLAKARRIVGSAAVADRPRLRRLPVVLIAQTVRRPRLARPAHEGATRSRATRRSSRARSPSRRTSAEDGSPHELAAALAALIEEYGPKPACWLATEVGRRKADVLRALHAGQFVMVGKGRAAKWDVAPIAAELERYCNEVWKARKRGVIDALDAIELLLEPKPQVLAMLAELAA